MNDFSLEIFNEIRKVAEAIPGGCFCTTSPITGKAKLPAIYVVILPLGEDTKTADSSGEEIWTRTTVEIQAYSGTTEHAARGIIRAVDDRLRNMGFRRSNYTLVPNSDPSIKRVSAKWRARINSGGAIAVW
ncbi:hypothetical protein K6V98_08330 [Collinsella sp. AGMB00827]|uniref:DUF3168 domain-containing protein n=1 Tax=Collinsella ureilytica TaxID=2869515 RepID=A0ABS7MMS6_9ACTN|nr:hypothetical protein [Collinsella urealyticum]MBY4798351.1 hypothetical protein [Collinsella urealyticum]